MFLLKNSTIIAPRHEMHLKQVDILFDEQRILKIGECLEVPDRVELVADGVYVSNGWVDTFANFNDPGTEQNENVITGSKAAAAGGFSHVCVVPNTRPTLHSKSQVEYIKTMSTRCAVQLHAIGAITKNCDGVALADIYDMHSSGVRVFSDGYHSMQNAGDVSRAMQYLKPITGVYFNLPSEASLALDGLVHESETTVASGLRTLSTLSETLMLLRDIELATYNNSAIHVPMISAKESVAIVKKAKANGVKVTCGVAIHQLLYTDADTILYDSMFKTQPPFRAEEDRKALLDGLLDGTIDVICSNHRPCSLEEKVLEFEYAAVGQSSIQTCLAAYVMVSNDIDTFVQAISHNPRRLLGLPTMRWIENETLDITIFDPFSQFEFTESMNYSKSKNHPLLRKILTGKVLKTIKPSL